MPDEADNPLIELAIVGNADWDITQDVAGGELKHDSFGVVTPEAWREDEE